MTTKESETYYDFSIISIPEPAINVIANICAIVGRQYYEIEQDRAVWKANNFHEVYDDAVIVEWRKHDESSAQQFLGTAGKWGLIEVIFNPWGKEMDEFHFPILGYCRWHQEHRAEPLLYRELDFDEILSVESS